MTEQTIVAVYDTAAQAAAVTRELIADGVAPARIGRHDADASAGAGKAASARKAGFWGSRLGAAPGRDIAIYDRSIAAGSTVLTVRVAGERYVRVTAILERHNPVDLEERAAGYGLAGPAATRPSAALPVQVRQARRHAPGGTLPLAGGPASPERRAVRGRTTRIRRYSVETAAERQVCAGDEVPPDGKRIRDATLRTRLALATFGLLLGLSGPALARPGIAPPGPRSAPAGTATRPPVPQPAEQRPCTGGTRTIISSRAAPRSRDSGAGPLPPAAPA